MLEYLNDDGRGYVRNLKRIWRGYVRARGIGYIESWKEVFIEPTAPILMNPLFIINNNEDKYTTFLIHKNSTVLPDFVSQFIQLKFHIDMPTDIHNLIPWYSVCVHLVDYFYLSIYSYSIVSIFLILNPYEFPWNIITACSQWYFNWWNWVLPPQQGLGLGGAAAFVSVGMFQKWIRKLVFTMPYLPTEGRRWSKSKVAYIYHGIPKIWTEHGVPSYLRDKWWAEDQGQVIKYFLKRYGSKAAIFFPDSIMEKVNTRIMDSNIKSGVPIPVSLDLQHFSANSISDLNQIFHTDIITNHILTIYEKLAHNF